MGTARITCVSGCKCEATDIDGTWEQQATLMQNNKFKVGPGCVAAWCGTRGLGVWCGTHGVGVWRGAAAAGTAAVCVLRWICVAVIGMAGLGGGNVGPASLVVPPAALCCGASVLRPRATVLASIAGVAALVPRHADLPAWLPAWLPAAGVSQLALPPAGDRAGGAWGGAPGGAQGQADGHYGQVGACCSWVVGALNAEGWASWACQQPQPVLPRPVLGLCHSQAGSPPSACCRPAPRSHFPLRLDQKEDQTEVVASKVEVAD